MLVLAATGTRFSQLIRMRVADVQAAQKRLMIPVSRKGRGVKQATHIGVRVGDDVLIELARATAGRKGADALFLRPHWRQVAPAKWVKGERGPWFASAELTRPWAAIVSRAGLPVETIPYALRHSSIVRGLRAGLPVRLVAALHDTSWAMMSAPGRAVYIQIGSRYDGGNNGRIAYSVRDAAAECNVAINTASKSFKELIDLGFVEETRHGALSRKTRVASEWRLTAFRCDLTGALKTCAFMQRGPQARARRQGRGRTPRLSQTTISAVSTEVRECLKTDNSLSQTAISDSAECLKRRSVEAAFEGSPVSNEGTLLGPIYI